MKDFATLLALPASLLTLVASSTVHAQELAWPYNLPRTVKYYPEDEKLIKRDAEIQKTLAWQAPLGMSKMSDEEGEKFFLHYWDFGTQDELVGARCEGYDNSSTVSPLRPAIARHSNHDRTRFNLFRRNIFARDFKCPANTFSCTDVGQDDLCCTTGETCVSTSEGVGCCPAGQTCGDEIKECTGGYTSCPNSPNGGCCVPGATCAGTGCVFFGTETITTTLPTATVTNEPISTTKPTISVSEYTTTVTVTPSGHTTTRTVTISASSCSLGFFSCPASLGGGCCPNGQGCATDDECPDITSTVSPEPPVLQTSVSVSAATESSTTDTGACPTGFYMCSANYLGGCCRVGRNCQTTSCPPADTSVIVNSGVTVAQSVSTSVRGRSCANGWFSCGSGAGGGCCPSGYECGASSCSAAGRENTAKMPPNGGNVLRWAWSFLGLGVVAGVGMILL